MTVKQVANHLGVSPDTVRRWSDQGLLNGYRLPSGHRRFHERDVADFRSMWFGDEAAASPIGRTSSG
ncbi:MAG: helix-turn-helix domain-containing protein [Chloroflexi bacterium]|nr:helix-turn-helix domain-containing protein [Chloroflexota bacterium]